MARSIFTCSTCGAIAAKWHGQCPACADWNTLVEEAAPARGAGGAAKKAAAIRPVPLRDVRRETVARMLPRLLQCHLRRFPPAGKRAAIKYRSTGL